MLFQIFDFDKDQHMHRAELLLMLRATAEGVSKYLTNALHTYKLLSSLCRKLSHQRQYLRRTQIILFRTQN